MSEPQKEPKTDQTSRPCPEGQEMGSDGKCKPAAVKKATDSQDNPKDIQMYKDILIEKGYKLSKDNCDSLAALRQLYEFAKANPKEKPKTDSDLKPPELPPAADTHKDTQKRITPPTPQIKTDENNAIFQVKIDSIIPDWDKLNLDPNNDPKKVNLTDAQDAALVKHMDALEQSLFNYTDNPFYEIEPSSEDSATKDKNAHKPQKSPRYDTEESKAKRKADKARVAELKKLGGNA